jgi:AraC-like DNA-binding protein
MDFLAMNERYDYVATPRDRQWGFHVAGTGTRVAPPRVPYQVYERNAPFQWSRGRTLPYYGLVYLVAGEGEFSTDERRRQCVRAGDMLLLFPDVWHNYRPCADTGWTEFWVLYDGRLPDHWAAQQCLRPEQPVLWPGIDPGLVGLFEQMLSIARSGPPFANQLLAALVMQIVAVLLARVQDRDNPHESVRRLIERAQQHIDSQWNQPIDMKQLAASLQLSYRHFRRLFQRATGVPPGQYLLNLRVNRAKRLLAESRPVAEVAEQSGFSDPYYFSRVFKQKTGIPPARWRT